MSEEHRVRFGISKETEATLAARSFHHLGFILDAEGWGASGVFVETPDGRTALLTARHNLMPCVLSGELTVSYMAGSVARSVEPDALRLARKCDAALVYMPSSLDIPRLSLDDWVTAHTPAIRKGEGVIAVGAPSEWASEPDVAARVIERKVALLYWTAVLDPDWDGQLLLDVDEAEKMLPSSFGGISGGPLFNLQGQLIGIGRSEHRDEQDGYLYATRRSDWSELCESDAPLNLPSDLVRQTAALGIDVVHESWPADAEPIQFCFAVDFFWSQSAPGHAPSSFGHMFGAIISGAESVRYPMNLDTFFALPENHDENTRYMAFHDVAVQLLADMKLRPSQPQSE